MPVALPEFGGYTVDERLRQFRKIKYGELPEFIPFDSNQGQCLLAAYVAHQSGIEQRVDAYLASGRMTPDLNVVKPVKTKH